MVKEYFLIDLTLDDIKPDKVTITLVNVNKNSVSAPVTSAKTPQTIVKETIVKETITNQTRAREDEKPVDNFGRMDGEELYPDTEGNAETETPAPANGSVESSDFMTFWSAYPRRAGMDMALEAWAQLMKQGISPVALVQAAAKYAAKVKKDETAEKFVKMPHNFLLEQCWKGYVPPPVPDCKQCKHWEACRGRGGYQVEEYDEQLKRSYERLFTCPYNKQAGVG